MRLISLPASLRVAGVALSLMTAAHAQDAQPRAEGLPPRAAPAEYQAQGRAGEVTIGAEYTQHSVPTPDSTFTTEDYIMVEVGMFGPPGKKLAVTPGDFSLRVNGRKQVLPGQPFGFVLKSLKSPDWEMQQAVEKAEKSRMNVGGADPGGSADKPPPPKMPIGVQRAMEQKVQRASYPEGERTLPAAGLLYFEYRGSLKGIRSLELMYAGPAGKATLVLQP